MLRVLWSSKNAMDAMSDKMDAISNNMANLQTEGYKKVDVNFQDLVGESLDRLGYPNSKSSILNKTNFTGTGVRASDWIRQNTQGPLSETGNKSDFAIDGEGFFQLTTPKNETVYTRAGSFQIDGKGRLTDSNGDILKINFDKGYNSGNVKFTNDNYDVTENGDIVLKDKSGSKKVGNIPLYSAIGDNAFLSIGSNLYVPDKNVKVTKSTNASIRQGFIENSNVDVTTEMTDMIVTQRAFELASKGIKTADDMWGIANNLRSK